MTYDPEKLKSGEDFVAKLSTAEAENLTIRVGRFWREAQEGADYVQRGIRVFSSSERRAGIDGKQFPEAEYWSEKDFELEDLPYITVWLLEMSLGSKPNSIEDFLRSFELFMGDPRPLSSEFFERQRERFDSLDDFFRQMDDFLDYRDVVIRSKSPRSAVATRRRDAHQDSPDGSQLELF